MRINKEKTIVSYRGHPYIVTLINGKIYLGAYPLETYPHALQAEVSDLFHVTKGGGYEFIKKDTPSDA